MSDILRQTSEQYANRIAALNQQMFDARQNIEKWENERLEVEAAKEHNDSKLPEEERAKVPVAAGRAANTPAEVLASPAAQEKGKK